MTAKCPMDLDNRKLNSTYPCGHFDTYSKCKDQSGQKLEHVETWSKIGSSKIKKIRFGLTVWCIWYMSAWKFNKRSDYMWKFRGCLFRTLVPPPVCVQTVFKVINNEWCACEIRARFIAWFQTSSVTRMKTKPFSPKCNPVRFRDMLSENSRTVQA